MNQKSVRSWLVPNWFVISAIVIATALVVAAVLNAPLTWDGSYYLFAMLDTHEPFIAQNRVADRYLHYPVVWTLELTGSDTAGQAVFNLIHVATPLVALVLSWWVVRKRAPELMVWPMLCIGLALLPGQINFISEGIKAEQLMWPLLLALMVGLPLRSVPMVLAVAITIYTLHPVSAPILAASGLAALVLGVIRKQERTRLVPAGIILIAAGIYRFLGVNSGYEQSELTWETQSRQWSNGAGGLPTVALIACALIAIAILIRPLLSSRWNRWIEMTQLVALIVGLVALVIWAANPAYWWEALEFRGPAFWMTMLGAGGLFLHVVIAEMRGTRLVNMPTIQMLTLASGFAIVIAVQSVSWNQVVQGLDDQIEGATQACIAREDVAGYPYSPLNLWTTNSLSLVMQGQQPKAISMRNIDCHIANQTGEVFVNDSQINHTPTNFDFHVLHERLPQATVCTWQETSGWHQQEALIPDTWRWSDGTGSIDISMPETGTVLLRGEFRTFQSPNTITVVIDGTEFGSSEITTLGSESFAAMPIRLPAGTTTVSFVSANEAAIPEGDGRPLALSVWNLTIRPDDGSSPCLKVGPA